MTETPAPSGSSPLSDPAIRPTAPATDEEQIIDFHSDFWEKHKGKILSLAAVTFLAILGVAWWQFTEESTRKAAATAFAQAKSLEDYEAIVRSFPNSPVAAQSLLLAADLLAADSKYGEARARLDELIGKYPNHAFVSGAHLRRALLAENSGQTDVAISELRALVSNFPSSYAAPIASLNLVRLLDAQGKNAEATTILQRFGASHTGSIFLSEAETEMRFRAANTPLPRPTASPLVQESSTAPHNPIISASATSVSVADNATPGEPSGTAPATTSGSANP